MQGGSPLSPLKPSPWGEGGWPSGQTDEGAMIEQFRFLQGDFAACGRRVSFPAMGKKPKDRRGRAPMGVPAHSRTSPRPPFTGVIPIPFCRSSGAQNMVPGFWFLPGHLALMRCKIPVCSSSPPRLVPTSRGRGCGIGGVPIGIAPKTRNSGPVSRPYGVFMTPFGSRGTDTVSRLRRSPYHA